VSETAGIHVLHVDDEPDFVGLAADMLEREDSRYSVETATSASEGLDRLAQDDFDCIVSDYQMPGKNGIEFLEAIRDEYPELPFILFTGKGSEEVASEAISAGATDYLQKGHGTDRYGLLANRIENAVGQYRARRRAAELDRIRTLAREINQALVRANSRSMAETRACEIISDSDPYLFAWIGDVDADTQRIESRASAGVEQEYLEQITVTADKTATGHGPGGTAIRERRVAVSQNIDKDPEFEPWRDDALERGYRSVAAVPLEHDDTLYGELVVYADRSDAFDESERELLADLGEDIGHAIHSLELQKTLREERDRRQALFENTPTPVIAGEGSDATRRIADVNDAFEEVFGYESGEVIGTDVTEAIIPDDEMADHEEFQTRATAGEPITTEVERMTADGRRKFLLHIIPYGWDSDGPEGTYAWYTDITDRKQREQQLERTNTVLRTIVENLPMGVVVEDAERNILMANDQLGEILGVPVAGDDLIGRDCDTAAKELQDLFADPGEFIDTLNERMEQRELVQNEEIHLADGRVLERDYLPYSLPEGEANLWLYRDITDRKEERARLEFLETLENRLTELSIEFLNTEGKDIGALIDNALENIGTLVEADRSYMFEIDRDGKTLSNTYEWCGEGAEPQKEMLQDLPLDTFPWWMQKMENHETLTISAVSQLPPEAAAEQEILQEQDITSVVVAPMVSEGELVGFIGFDWVEQQDAWSEDFINVLQICSEIFSSAIQRESRRRELERREAYLEQSSDIISVMDSSGEVTYQSTSTERVTGFSPAEVIGVSGFEHVHPEDVEKLEGVFSSFVAQPDEEVQLELRVETKDGDWRWIEVRGVNKLNDPVIEGLLFSSRDISERKEREQELKERNQEIEEREEQFKILHSAGEQLMQATSQEEAAEITIDAAKNILGYARPALRLIDENGRTLKLVATTEENVATAGKRPDYQADEDIPAARTYRRQEPEIYDDLDDTNDEYDRGALRSGLYVPVSDYGVFSCGAPEPNVYDETDVNILEVLTNLTATALTRIESERELRQKNMRLDKFASIVSHDLRNPLEVAMGQVELARDECDTPHLEQAATAHDRIAAIIEDTLTLSRLGKTVENIQDVELKTRVHQCWELVETGAATLDPPSASVKMRADPDRLQQIFENLFRNAVEHAGEGVTVSVDRLEDGFAVSDDGPGLPDGIDVFETGESTSAEGTGFGLSIVEEIVTAHGWEIHTTESETGGARFEITGVEFAAV